MAHLDEKHGSQVSDDTLDGIIAKSAFRTFGITNCPLCNEKGPTDAPELIEHVLGHIYDFSMYALPWRTTYQAGLRRPIRTFNDVAPVIEQSDNEDATKMRMLSHVRMLEWVKERHAGDENITPERKTTIRDLDWDDYQATYDEDRVDPIATDYFDHAEIDYFEDDASSGGASSQGRYSASTRQLSIASSSGYSSGTQPKPLISAPALNITFTKSDILEDDESHFFKERTEASYIQAPEDEVDMLGMDHPDMLASMAILALIYTRQHRTLKAERFQMQLMDNLKMKLGAGDPDTLTVMETLKTKLGAGHPDTLTSMTIQALTIWKQGRWGEAERLQVQVMDTLKTKLGAEHPDTLTSMAILALIYDSQGRRGEAERLQIQVMHTLKTELTRADHPNRLTNMANLVLIYEGQERLLEAEFIQVQVLATLRTKLGHNHPDTMANLTKLLSIYNG